MSELKKWESEFLLTEKQASAMLLQAIAEQLAWDRYGTELFEAAEEVLEGLSFQDKKDIISSRIHGATFGQEQVHLIDLIDKIKDKCKLCMKPMFLHIENARGIIICPSMLADYHDDQLEMTD